jgi:hypothetical protein
MPASPVRKRTARPRKARFADARKYFGPARDHLPGGLAIRLEIVLPAEQVVVYPRRMRHGDVEAERAAVALIARHKRTL